MPEDSWAVVLLLLSNKHSIQMRKTPPSGLLSSNSMDKIVYFAICSDSSEEVEDRIIYFYPPSSTKEKQIGLIFGLIEFTNTFFSSLKIICSNNHKTIITKHKSKFIILKTTSSCPDYLLSEILEKTMKRFDLFYNDFDLNDLNYMTCLNTCLESMFNNISLKTQINHLLYYKSDPRTVKQALKIKSKLKAKIMLMYKNTVMLSWLDTMDDTQVIYDYLTDPSTGYYDDFLCNQQKPKGVPVISSNIDDEKEVGCYTGYIIGPTEEELELNLEPITRHSFSSSRDSRDAITPDKIGQGSDKQRNSFDHKRTSSGLTPRNSLDSPRKRDSLGKTKSPLDLQIREEKEITPKTIYLKGIPHQIIVYQYNEHYI
jgi:hypothetical protein